MDFHTNKNVRTNLIFNIGVNVFKNIHRTTMNYYLICLIELCKFHHLFRLWDAKQYTIIYYYIMYVIF